jgi:hypothetical protein
VHGEERHARWMRAPKRTARGAARRGGGVSTWACGEASGANRGGGHERNSFVPTSFTLSMHRQAAQQSASQQHLARLAFMGSFFC